MEDPLNRRSLRNLSCTLKLFTGSDSRCDRLTALALRGSDVSHKAVTFVVAFGCWCVQSRLGAVAADSWVGIYVVCRLLLVKERAARASYSRVKRKRQRERVCYIRVIQSHERVRAVCAACLCVCARTYVRACVRGARIRIPGRNGETSERRDVPIGGNFALSPPPTATRLLRATTCEHVNRARRTTRTR